MRYGTIVTGTGAWRARLTATEPTMRCVALAELPTTMVTTSSGRVADRLGRRDQLLGDQALAPLEMPLDAAKLLRDLVEAGLHDGHGVGRQLHATGQVSHPDHRDPARPDGQQTDRDVQRPRGRGEPSNPTTRCVSGTASTSELIESRFPCGGEDAYLVHIRAGHASAVLAGRWPC